MAESRVARVGPLIGHEGELPPGSGNAHRQWRDRQSLRVPVSAEGLTGYGEAAPLPGYSPDSLAENLSALDGLDEIRLGEGLATSWKHLPKGLPAAAQFALETAILDWWGLRLERPAAELLAELHGSDTDSASVPLSGLLPSGAEADQVLASWGRLVAQGYAGVKLKIGRDLETELALARRGRAAHPECGLRLDANGVLSRAQAELWLPRFGELGIELFEEPCGDLATSRELGQRYALPVALDESLQLRDGFTRESLRGFSAVVLKPTALGGLARCLQLAEEARAADADITVSHCFEGPTAWSACAALARVVASRRRPSGLAPHSAMNDLFPGVSLPGLARAELRDSDKPGLGGPRWG